MIVVILGDKSDIAQGLRELLEKDGHAVFGWHRAYPLPTIQWDLVISCLGTVAPVGPWYESGDWNDCFESNLFLPVKLLKKLWKNRNENASVCFMAGSNPQQPMRGYAPYNAAKMALLKVVEQLDYETPTVKFFALGPGYMDTKIHKPTKDRGWYNPRIEKGNPNTIEQVYRTLKWCLEQPQEVVGGRNICVSDVGRIGLEEYLRIAPDMFKLRRIE